MALNFPDSPTLNQVYTDSTSGFSYQWNGTVWISYTASSTGNIRTLDDISGSFDNATQTFALTSGGIALTPANPQSLVINLGGVVQDPTDDYTISGSNIIFSTPPASGLSFSGILLGVAVPVGVSTGDVYFRQTYFPTGVQTSFTFVNGYTSGYLDVYKNGVKLLSSSDYSASDGINFSLTPAAQSGDEIEAIGYRVSSIAITNGSLNTLSVSGDAIVGGVTTSLGGFVGDLTGNATYSTTAGIATYASTAGVSTVAQGLTGTPNIVVGIATVNTTLSLGGNYIEDVNAVGALDIDCSAGNYFTKTINGNSTFTVSNVPATGAYAFTLELTHTSGTVTWFSGVEWPGGVAPTLTTGKTHLFMFVTDDGGTRWRGSSLVDYTN